MRFALVGPGVFVVLMRAFGPEIAILRDVRKRLRSRVGKTSWVLACALTILGCALPVNADTLQASHAVAPDRLVDPSLFVSGGEFLSFSTDLVPHAEAYEILSAFVAVPSDSPTLDLLPDRRDPAENGEAGVRRFLFFAILFGAALRYLTSPAFYDWAADVFNPLDEY